MRIQSTVAAAALAFALARAGGVPRAASSPASFRDIRPILQAHCTICHAPHGPAPMPLVTAEDARPWARQIKETALARRMPIWHAARGYGAFSNDPALSPYELNLIVAWADALSAPAPPAPSARPAPSTRPESGSMVARVRNGWITGWTFVPGDPLITAATFTSADGSPLGAWVAGDRPARLPPGSAMRVASPIHVEIQRREATSYETAFTPRASTLQFSRLPPPTDKSRGTPARRIRIEHVACGGTLGPAEASIVGVRPRLAAGAAAHVSVERIGGAQPVLLGWFRDFDPRYARIYWLARPLDFAANARVTSDAPCDLDVFLSARR